MQTDHLREFITLALNLSYTETAKQLNITQPALSKHIAALEKEVGMELINRSAKTIQLTEAGRIFFEGASLVVNQLDDVMYQLNVLKTCQPIVVGGQFDDADVASLMSIASMVARNTYNANLSFEQTSRTKGSIDMLKQGEIDVLVDYVDPSFMADQGLMVLPIMSNHLGIIVSKGHHLADRESVSWNDLRNEVFVQFVSDKTLPAWGQIERLCLEHGFTPKTRPVPSHSDVEFFSTRLGSSVLVWKQSQKQIGILLETGNRSNVPISEEDAWLTSYAVYLPEKEETLKPFFEAVADAQDQLQKRHIFEG